MSDRPFKLTVAVISETSGDDGERKTQQNVFVEEFSDSAQEHVLKNFHIAEAVSLATTAAMKELAAAAGFITELGKLPKPNAPGKP